MNYYDILEVTVDSDISEIKSAYRRLARKFHPDINPDGIRRFKKISEAYDVLSNEEKRKQYDIIHGFFKKAKTEEKSNTSYSTDTNKESSSSNFKSKKFGSKENQVQKSKILDDILNIFYSKKVHNANTVQQKNGEDINTDVTITLEEALNGTETVVNIIHSELCPRCRGRKFINGAKCPVCDGLGEYTQYKRINVKIPANVKNGSKLRIKGEGNDGKFGGKNGDLYLLINIQPNDNIKYDGLNILYNTAITPFDAVLGGEISLFNGLKLKIPPKTTSGQKFRLTSQGLKKNGKQGDIIVTVNVEISKDLSDDEIRMYEKLRKMSKS